MSESNSSWNQMREMESQISRRTEHVTGQLYHGYDARELWSVDPVRYEGYDRVLFSSFRKLFRSSKIVELSLFSSDDLGGVGPVRQYEVDLREGKEGIAVHSFDLTVDPRHMCRGTQNIIDQRYAARRFARQVPAITLPTKSDFYLLLGCLNEGLKDSSVIWSPLDELPD